MNLNMIAELVKGRLFENGSNIVIESFSTDSRLIHKNCLFVARRGLSSDGLLYVQKALDNGAEVYLSDRIADVNSKIPFIIVPDVEECLEVLSNALYGRYKEMKKLIGITGTNGKTTSAYFLQYCFKSKKIPFGLMSTIDCFDGKKKYEAFQTTPSNEEIKMHWHNCASNGIFDGAMEVSSHALKQNRLRGIKFSVGIFTNLTQDHLDYHENMQDYLESKLRLLDQIEPEGTVVINLENLLSKEVVKRWKGRVLSVGETEDADFRVTNINSNESGTEFTLEFNRKAYLLQSPLIGKHNVYNVTQCLAACYASGLDITSIIADLKSFDGVAGRLEKVVGNETHPHVYVDYAHTPDAIENVVRSVLPIKKGSLKVLFGCGGDRDPVKRPLMAKAAELYADEVYVTSDNPRTEDAHKIIREILVGFETKQATVIADRAEAIKHCIQHAKANDIILLLGKGHETYQIIGKQKFDFDDRVVVKKIFEGHA